MSFAVNGQIFIIIFCMVLACWSKNERCQTLHPSNNSAIDNVSACVHEEDGQLHLEIETSEVLKTPYWRVRVVGPRIQLLATHRSNLNERVWLANATLCAGSYFVEPLLLFRAFNATTLRSCVEQSLQVLAEPFGFRSTLECTFSTGWLAPHNNTTLLQRLSRTREQLHNPASYDWSELRYVPRFAPPDRTAPLRHGHYCFVGDSHIRHVFNDLLRMRGVRCNVDSVHKWCFDPDDLLEYVQLRWARIVPPRETLQRCSVVLINVGQWPAGWPEEYPQTAAQYRRELEPFLRALVNRTAQGTPTWFLSTYASALDYRRSVCPPTDWRTDPVIRLYNRIAQEVVSEVRQSGGDVEFVDMSHIVEPVADLGYDFTHFDGPVGAALLQHVWQRLLQRFREKEVQ